MLNRDDHLRRLREEAFDLLVVGGGITGAAVARDAARRGFRTGLVEARDFSEGTSSRSSRLVHGGLRYLEQLEFDLVFEASRERRRLLRIAPQLVRPLEFTFPLYREGRIGRRRLDAGMWLYDALSLFRNIERHQMLDADEVLAREPGLRGEGLLGGARYFDAQVDDARLVLATVVAAAEEGAAVANRLEAVGLRSDEGPGHAVRIRDAESGAEWPVHALTVLLAAGPWTDRLRRRIGLDGSGMVRTSRGSHIHVRRDRLGHRSALIFESPVDGRIMFVLPWRDLTLIGTTDDFDDVPPERVVPTAEDVAYLLESTNGLFPEVDLGPADVLSAWAGLRPLAAAAVDAGSGEEESAGRAGEARAEAGRARGGDGIAGAAAADGAATDRARRAASPTLEEEEELSRDFVLREGPSGVFTLAGGKLTSHRAMAEEAVDRVAPLLAEAGVRPSRRSDTHRVPLPGGDFEEPEALRRTVRARAAALGIGAASADRLSRAYGTRAERLLALAAERPELARPVVAGRPHLRAEVVHAVREEMALHAEDVALRRTRLALEVGPALGALAAAVSETMGEELGWDAKRVEEEAERLRAARDRDEAWRG